MTELKAALERVEAAIDHASTEDTFLEVCRHNATGAWQYIGFTVADVRILTHVLSPSPDLRGDELELLRFAGRWLSGECGSADPERLLEAAALVERIAALAAPNAQGTEND